MNEFKKNIFKKRTSDVVVPPITSNIGFSNAVVYQLNGSTNPYPDGGGSFNYEVGQCDINFLVSQSNINAGDILTIRFQSFSSYSIKQCCGINYAGIVTPSTIQAINPMGIVDINITYNGIDNLSQPFLITPTGSLQPTLSASSTMTLYKINGTLVDFTPTTNNANLITPSNGAVTMTIT
jgi:hypothetical protein